MFSEKNGYLINKKNHIILDEIMTKNSLDTMNKVKRNRLANELSPYLQQHADNPVDWYPWCDEAFDRARREDKPVFLSIGYSTCHWCHVMAHESFEDEEVARILNDHLISIKLDREERPELDQLYMAVTHALTGRGGWPMSVFLTPERKPFFAGTYFPKHSRGGHAGFIEILSAVKDTWTNRRNELLRSSEEIILHIQKESGGAEKQELSKKLPDHTFQHLSSAYDPEYGGFGNAPKFPTPHYLLFLLRYWKRTAYGEALSMVEHTLMKMRYGGIYDHLGFGFCRYSTDRRWFLPHFEKMLYDQALLSMAYIETYQITQNEFYRNVAEEILSFVLNNMSSPEGGFYSAYDADSEGEEGKYYVWTEDELKSSLSRDDFHFAKHVWNTLPEGNYSDEASGQLTNLNILHQKKDNDILAYEQGLTEYEFSATKERIRQMLLSVRDKRTPPFLDDKILVDWNGLMIAALAKASSVLHSDIYLRCAELAADFIFKRLRKPDGRLYRRFRNGHSGIEGHLDDYAFIVWGLIELYEASAKPDYLHEAISLTKIVITDFWDHDRGGFYLASAAASDLIMRNKESYDSAYPSGNSVAAHNLVQLGRMTGNTEWIAMAEQIGIAFAGDIQSAPTGFTHYISAYTMMIESGEDIIITGNPDLSDYQNLVMGIQRKYLPDKTIVFRDDRKPGDLYDFIPSLRSYPFIPDGVKCYVCKDSVCRAADVNELLFVNN
jgi:hypothetical protein